MALWKDNQNLVYHRIFCGGLGGGIPEYPPDMKGYTKIRRLCMNTEIWKDIKGYEGKYQISNQGRVKSLERITNTNQKIHEKILKPRNDKDGYFFVGLYKEGHCLNSYIHRLVAKYFIENTYNKPQVNHIDGDKHNNKVSNLEWVTGSENQLHAYSTGLKKAKVMPTDVIWIRENFKKYDKVYGESAIAKKFNINRATVLRIINYETWKNI